MPDLPAERRTFEIRNTLGLHLRAAGQLVELAKRYDAEVLVFKDGQEANGKSILALVTLAATQGSIIEVHAVGPQALEVLDALGGLIESNFNET